MKQEKIWDEISDSWHSFRQLTQKDVLWFYEKYCKKLKGKVLDIGCGNARNLLPFENFEKYGVDFSSNMIENAKKFCLKKEIECNLKKADMRKLPFKNNFFEICMMPSSLHNLKKDSQKAINEMHRVLKRNGIAFVSVWNKEKELNQLPDKEEAFVSWRTKGETYQRYYHLYDSSELKEMLKDFKILKSVTFSRNLVFVLKKI